MTFRHTPPSIEFRRRIQEATALLSSNPGRAQEICANLTPKDANETTELALVAAEAAIKLTDVAQAQAQLARVQEESAQRPFLRGRWLKLKSQTLMLAGDLSLALHEFELALDEARRQKNLTLQAEVLNFLAQIHHAQNNGHLAFDSLKEARQAYRASDSASGEIRVICNMGLILLTKGKMGEALQLLNEAKELLPRSETLQDSELGVSSNLGMLFEKMGRYEEAKGQFVRAMHLAQQMQRPAAEATMLLNAGEMAQHLGEVSEAQQLLTSAAAQARALNIPTVLSAALSSLANIYGKQGLFDEAERFLSEGQELALSLGSVDAQLDTMLSRGRNWLGQGRRRQAIDILNQALLKAQQIDRPEIALQIHLLLADAHASRRVRRSLHHMRRVRELERSLRDESLARQARDLSAQAELASARLVADHERNLRMVSEEARRQAEATVKSQMEALERGRLNDELTGLPNRLLLRTLLHRILEEHGTLALILIDLDNFRKINDAFGHQEGDRALREVTRRLKEAMEQGDALLRSGSDEFVLLVPRANHIEDVERRVSMLKNAFVQEFMLGGQQVVIRATMGASLAPDHGVEEDSLMMTAGAALALAKEGLGHTVYEGDVEDRAARLSVESALSRALERNEFSLFYQPLVRGGNGEVLGAEALLRWENPVHGQRSPVEFIPLLERSGGIEQVGEWVLKTACLKALTWNKERISVNLSARQFLRGDLAGTVARTLYETGLEGQRLELEITESLMMQSPERAAVMLQKLRATGVRVVLDDFGTGYSNLSYLHDFPIDGLKIDRSFVRALEMERGGAIVEAIVRMCRDLGMDVVAEGVETEEQWARLRALKVPILQGYLFGKPSPDWSPPHF